MNGNIAAIIIALIFGPVLALPVRIVGLFNLMDLALFSLPLFSFVFRVTNKSGGIKDAFKAVIPCLIVSLILTTFVLFIRVQIDCTNK